VTDFLAQFRRWQRQIDALPEPLRYVVLDHRLAGGKHILARDREGRKYLQCSPSLLDELRHDRGSDAPLGALALPHGIAVYRRDSMHEGWDEAP
jgi:hypothetical protein